MSDEDFKRDMITRNVPQIGRAGGLRRHKAAKYRRDVLEHLVGWWVGCQPVDRPLGERYRRFYLRYGVDMSTAFTLNESETDILIERIKTGFSYDI